MPITGNRGNVRKAAYRLRGRSARTLDVVGPREEAGGGGDVAGRIFLHIRPALPDPRASLAKRSHTTLGGSDTPTSSTPKEPQKEEAVSFQAVGEGKVQLARTNQEKDRLPDRISLDRRGLSSIPHIVGEPDLRLLSLQHNLISSLVGLAPLDLNKLIFLDIYDNQIDKISSLEKLSSLRVLLMGKNRIRRIEGLANLNKLEVLDLHGNRITKVSGLSLLSELKVLNLAGNQIKCIGATDLQGLVALRELNLKRNRLKRLLGFAATPKLQKLFLSNNDLQSVEDMSSLAMASSLREVTLEGNPVALGGDCAPFLVSYLPSLTTLTNMNVTDQVRRAAMAWRRNKEAASAAYSALGDDASAAARRDEVINNARTNWELLRSENRCFTTSTGGNLSTEFVLEATTATVTGPSDILGMTVPETSIQLDSEEVGKETNAVDQSKQPARKLRSSTARKPSERRVTLSERSASQDTDASHSTSTSSELLRLPPILLPIISSLENVKISGDSSAILKRWESISISSVDPVVDSSLSSLPSSSSDSEDEKKKKTFRRVPTALRRRANFSTIRSKSVCDPVSLARAKSATKIHVDNCENASNLLTGTNVGSVVTNSSTSGSDHTNRSLRREGSVSRANSRNIKSATTARRSEHSVSLSRASTARVKSGKIAVNVPKTSDSIPKPVALPKDREQGVDYLVEVSGREIAVWGGGAVRHLEREWDAANLVTHASFHYVTFNAVATVLPKLKSKFPNIAHVSVRATGLQWLGQLHALAELRGIKGLRVLPEGNPIHAKCWQDYALYRLAHWGLRSIDDKEVSEEDVLTAYAMYAGLGEVVVRALPDAPLQPLLARLGRAPGGAARCWLRRADPALRDLVAKEALQWRRGNVSQEDMSWRVKGRSHLSHMVELTCGSVQRLQQLQTDWPAILLDMIEETLRDFQNMDQHVQDIMRQLMDEL